jgi:hypothetical protein
MNTIQFCEKIKEIFGEKRVELSLISKPQINNYMYDDIQFIHGNGAISPPLNKDATEIWFDTPFEGPFFRLPVVGAYISQKSHGRGWWCLSSVVNLNGELFVSAPISIRSTKKRIIKEVTQICGNKWYRVDTTINPCRVIPYEQLV